MDRTIFIETSNVTKFNTAISTLESVDNGEQGFALVYGQAGRGKTETSLTYQARNGGIFLRVRQSWTQNAFLTALSNKMYLKPARSSAACKDRIIDRLNVEPQTIYVDEADRLHVGRIEDLRDIHDETGVPIVLIGERELHGVLGERRRLWSRVKHSVEFEPVAEEDVAILASDAAGLNVDPEACALIVKKADGDFRLVWTLLAGLEKVARTRQTELVDAKMVNAVAKKTLTWRR
ncbi:ATP-binding protein [Maridesulfovibrio sp.]|uniref:ATP-binding protein n=1 Tax=Maridesulfovibrio sp. TaxID=2795000 RepID=UPI002AA7A14A|nr:ATP-binding protein [Maridesulfovibrio sp.]